MVRLAALLLLLPVAAFAQQPIPYFTNTDPPGMAVSLNSLVSQINSQLSRATTNAALSLSCTTNAGCPAGSPVHPQGVWRFDFAPGYGAPPMLFLPQVGTCAANSMANDGGSCVNSANGNSWKAQAPEIDPREFGASALVADNSAAINAAVTYAASLTGDGFSGGTVRIHAPAGWTICAPIVWQPGVSFFLDKNAEIKACGPSTAMGAQTAAYSASVAGTSVMTVTAVTTGVMNIGDWASGPDILAGTFIQANASTPGTPCGGSACTGSGGAGTYNLSQAATGTTSGSYADNAPALSALVQTGVGAGNRVVEQEWSGGKLLCQLNCVHVFHLRDFERVDITRAFLVDVNGSYVRVGDPSQSKTTFELRFHEDRIDRNSATHAPVGNYGIESADGSANNEVWHSVFIGTSEGIHGQLADWYVDHGHIWTDPAGSRGDMLACIHLTDFGANIESNQCDIGTVGVDEGATLNAWIVDPSTSGYITTLAFNRANSQYGADKPAGSAMSSLGTNAGVDGYGNVAEFTSGHRWLNDAGGTVTGYDQLGMGNAGGAVFTPTSQDIALRRGALFVGGARSVMPAGLAGNDGDVLDFGGNAGASTGALYSFNYGGASGRPLSLNKSGGHLLLENANGGTAASYVCVDSGNNIVIQAGVC